MVYLAGDNNLSEECIWSLKEMYRAGVDKSIGLVAQLDPVASRMRRFHVSEDLEEFARRHRSRGAGASTVRSDPSDGSLFWRGRPVREGSDDMASKQTLTDFIKQAKAAHDADHYMLILSGHSSGVIGNSFLTDGFPVSAISMSELREALEDAGGAIDVLGMDSCGMGMAEVGYELRESARYLVASEGFEQNTGWPYHKVLEVLNKKRGKISPRALAASVVEAHTSYYSDYIMAGVSTDISACDLSKSADLADRVTRLADALRSKLPQGGSGEKVYVEQSPAPKRAIADAVILAHWRAQSYRFEEHTDLYDFCDLLEAGCRDRKIKEACAGVKRVIRGEQLEDGTYDGYVVNSCRSGGAFQYSNGVSIYFPWATFLSGYRKLSFSDRTTWDQFLRDYVEKTRRLPRHRADGYDPAPILKARRAALTTGGRDVLSVGTRDVLSVGTRDVLSVGTRDVLSVGTRMEKILTPEVKNPPDEFEIEGCS
jgi:hypothetical protein